MPMTREMGEALEPFRSYLQVLAELHLDRRLRGNRRHTYRTTACKAG